MQPMLTGAKKWISKKGIYICLVYIIGCLAFLRALPLPIKSANEWVLFYQLVLAVGLLNSINLKIPRTPTFFLVISLDDAIIFSCLVDFGLKTTLLLIAMQVVITPLCQKILIKKIGVWWSPGFNIAMILIAVTSSYYTYMFLGGSIGEITVHNLPAYVVSMIVYSSLNIVLVQGLFYIQKHDAFTTKWIKNIFKDSIYPIVVSFLSAVTLSFLLLSNSPHLALTLFVGLIIIASICFSQVFKLYDKIMKRVNEDSLTGLFSHGYFSEKLEEVSMDSKFSLAILDIDDLYKYNYALGHLEGDRLIAFFGKHLHEEFQELKSVVARYSGKQFGVLCYDKSARELAVILNRLLVKINIHPYKGREVLPKSYLSFSAGVVENQYEIFDKTQLIDNMFSALQYAKNAGKNFVHIYNDSSVIQKSINLDEEIRELDQLLNPFLFKDRPTLEHCKRVFKYSIEICDFINLTDQEKRLLILGALIHDIGKLEVSKEILSKKETLTLRDITTIRKHTAWGKEILLNLKKYDELIPIVESHHEHYNGSGYPRGLKGEQVPKLARILSVIDAFDAMTSEHVYQKARSFEDATEELKRCAGTQFDPLYVVAFINMLQERYHLTAKATT